MSRNSTFVTCIVLFILMAGNFAAHAEEAVTDMAQPPSDNPAEISADCHQMAGVYAVADWAKSPGFRGLVDEFIDPDYVMGKPAFTIAFADNGITSTGAISGNVTSMRVRLDEEGKPFAHFGGKARCALEFGESGGQMFLVSEDLSAMPEQELDMLIEYFARVWKEKAPKKKLRA
ncbi:MAG: hypothetical protein LBQ81_04670, partial [Zoogloeaceae bacterium]|nr:hypothetical protein [Zoogloeaceae bacterium]